MKTRNGFVSNSSSSSFVVPRYNGPWDKKPVKCLTRSQERLLERHGFIMDLCFYPDQVPDTYESVPEFIKKEQPFVNWVKSVTCNQDDELQFLISKHISFVSDIHYQHYTMIYDGKTDDLLIAQNFGKQAQMAGSDQINFDSDTPPIQKMKGVEYLKKHRI